MVSFELKTRSEPIFTLKIARTSDNFFTKSSKKTALVDFVSKLNFLGAIITAHVTLFEVRRNNFSRLYFHHAADYIALRFHRKQLHLYLR